MSLDEVGSSAITYRAQTASFKFGILNYESAIFYFYRNHLVPIS